ncbi:MFS transporter [Tsukamurella soli]
MWFRVGSVALIGFIAFEAFAVGTVLPRAAAQLHSTAEYSLAFGIQFAATIVAVAAAGPWVDRAGVRAPLLAGGVLFAAGLTVVGCAPTMTVLAAGRAVQGAGGGLLSVVLYAMAGRLITADARPRLFAAFSAAWVLPSLVGPALAGLAADTIGWRWVFLALAPLSLLATAATLRATVGLDEGAYRSDPAPTGRLVLPAAVAAGSTTVLQFAAPHAGADFLALSLGCLAIAAVATRRLLPPGTLRGAPGLPAVVLMNLLVAGGYFAAEVYLPLYLVSAKGMSPFAAGSVLTGAALAWAAAAALQGRVPDRGRARHRAALLGCGIVAVTLVGVAGCLAVSAPWPVVFVMWAAGGFGMGLAYPSASVLVLSLSTDREQGAGSGALKLAEAVGTTVTIALSGAVFAPFARAAAAEPASATGFAATMAVPVVSAVFAAVVATRLRPGGRSPTPTPPSRRRSRRPRMPG